MNNRANLLEKISKLDFATIELHLYLDTHPDDSAAQSKLNEYKAQLQNLTNEYVSKYGPISAKDKNADGWDWIADPWPWDRNCMEGNR
ncbi:MAG: spore coat protein CotJB [Clostridia bacterium]|nr:spore coat protein CotJB [Clostridia bacterium]